MPNVKECIVLMDTTYFGRNFGVMLFMSSQGKPVLWKYLKYETIKEYAAGIKKLEDQGVSVKGIVCDGRRGLFQALSAYPIQMCQFHQIAIVTRYITRRPRLEASKDLKEIMILLPKTDKDRFMDALNDWYKKWKDFMNERATNPETGKSHYIHKRLRSAYRSIVRNQTYLFTWQSHHQMPNTNNKLEGVFTDLKNKLRNHNGLNRSRKEKFINEFLKGI